MTKLLGLLFCLISILPSPAFPDTFQAKRADGSLVTFYLDLPADTSNFSLMALLQGSTCESVKDKYTEFQGFITQVLKMGVLTVEKPGFPSNGPGCPREYLEKNTIDQRLSDFQIVMEYLRANIPAWNQRLYLEGGSEGATVGGLLAPLVPEIKALMLLAGGGGRTMAQELLLLRRKEMLANGAAEDEIESALAEMRIKFEEIRSSPTPDQTWYGDTNTYKWWSSILDRDLIDPLQHSIAALYLVQGTADLSVPVESADELVAILRQSSRAKVTYVRRDGLSHSWINASGQSFAEHVFASTIIWLMALEDQELRYRIHELMKQNPTHPDLPELIKRMTEVDQRNTHALKLLVARSGFPLISSHGLNANRDGWLLTQHADHDVAFQRTVLGVLESALHRKDTNPPDVAYLTDRVMVNERIQTGRPAEQLFGSQGYMEAGCWVPQTILDAGGLDVRRAQYGLEPFSEYFRRINEDIGSSSCRWPLAVGE
jgi:hypothetical protein